MTEVAFHFNAPDKQSYACRLLRKGYLRGARLVVRTDAQWLSSLDTALWTFAQGEFIPHACEGDDPMVLQRSPIQIYSEIPVMLDASEAMVLVNLCSSMPPGYERFGRVIEVVTQEENERLQARERWKAYKQDGIELVRHDLKLAVPD